MNRLKIGAVVAIVLIGLFYMVAPNYPKIDSDRSLDNIKGYLESVLKVQAKNINMEALAKNKRVPVETEAAFRQLTIDMDKCNDNKECLIEAYDEYMDDWCTAGIRKYTRAKWMVKKFGVIGQEINKNMASLY